MDHFFDYMEIPEERKVKLVTFQLKGGTSLWWEQLRETRIREGRGVVQSWRPMKQYLRGRSLSLNYEKYLFKLYRRWSQGTRTVNEYTSEYLRLVAHNQLPKSDNQQATPLFRWFTS